MVGATEIHAMGAHCARRLGIGVPRIFILSDSQPKAMTSACDDMRPSIVVTTCLVRSLGEKELLAVIGHECGHIHNLHGAYNTLAELLVNPLARNVYQVLAGAGVGAGFARTVTASLKSSIALSIARWSCCAEVTCDRAGAICAEDSAAMVHALVKLQSGCGDALDGINIDAYVRQLDIVDSTPLRLLELGRTHPLTYKRIEAIRLFAGSDTYHSWCPPAGSDSPPLPITDIDAACEPLIRVWSISRPGEPGGPPDA